MAQQIRTDSRRPMAAAARPSWALVGSSMTRHLDWLEENTGRHATRDLVDGTLGRLEHQLLRLESGAAGARLFAAATALRDCGALLGNAALTRSATALLDGAEHHPRELQLRVERLLNEGMRTASWLRIWRALSTPACPAGLLARSAGTALASSGAARS